MNMKYEMWNMKGWSNLICRLGGENIEKLLLSSVNIGCRWPQMTPSWYHPVPPLVPTPRSTPFNPVPSCVCWVAMRDQSDQLVAVVVVVVGRTPRREWGRPPVAFTLGGASHLLQLFNGQWREKFIEFTCYLIDLSSASHRFPHCR